MLYQLTNTKRGYVFEAVDREIALAVCGILGNGAYGIQRIGDAGELVGEVEGEFEGDVGSEFVRLTGVEVEEVWDRHLEMFEALLSLEVVREGEGEEVVLELASQARLMFSLFVDAERVEELVGDAGSSYVGHAQSGV